MSVRLRPEVRRFAERMELKLREHDDDRGNGWRQMFDEDIRERLDDELVELFAVWYDREERKVEAADVANFLMFLTESRQPREEFQERGR